MEIDKHQLDSLQSLLSNTQSNQSPWGGIGVGGGLQSKGGKYRPKNSIDEELQKDQRTRLFSEQLGNNNS